MQCLSACGRVCEPDMVGVTMRGQFRHDYGWVSLRSSPTLNHSSWTGTDFIYMCIHASLMCRVYVAHRFLLISSWQNVTRTLKINMTDQLCCYNNSHSAILCLWESTHSWLGSGPTLSTPGFQRWFQCIAQVSVTTSPRVCMGCGCGVSGH